MYMYHIDGCISIYKKRVLALSQDGTLPTASRATASHTSAVAWKPDGRTASLAAIMGVQKTTYTFVETVAILICYRI